MVYRSSRRPPASEEEATNLHEQMSIESDDGSKEVKFPKVAGSWRTVAIVLIILSVCLSIGIIVLSTERSAETVPLCGKSSNSVSRVIDVSEPEKPGPFHDLTKKEIRNILSFLEKDPDVQLKKAEEAQHTDAVVFMMDLLHAKKAEVMAYLDGNKAQPERQGRVILFRRDLDPPMVHELACGPLPKVSRCSLIKSKNRRNPVEYSLRPFGYHRDINDIYDVLFKKVDKEMGYILRESYGASYSNCEPNRCLKFYPVPIGTNIIKNVNSRRMWMSALYPAEYYGGNVLDFGMLANLDGTDPSKFFISNVWYHGQFFDSVDDFIVKYNSSSIKKTRMSPPSDDKRDSFSALLLQGEPLPETPQRPPTLVEPDGKRYSLKNREVDYLGWKFNFRMSALSGPSLGNIRFKGERIAYELSMAEIAVIYSANNPMQRATDYVDSGALIGTHSKSLVPGADCPDTATFIPQTFPSQMTSDVTVLKRAFCLFENNHGYPARRHLSYSQYEGAFYGGMLDSALTLRTILTIVNYDYIVDFIFHQTGTIQTRVMSTGYILPAFYYPEEDQYGFQTEKNFIANLHHHIFHFKADLDISGTSNRYETLDIKPDTVQIRVPPKPMYHQTRVERNLHKTEKDALFKFNFDEPKYHVVHNNAKKTDFGQMKAYRIQMQGMSKHLLPENENNEIAFAWARHQLVVTKQKDDEFLSSSPYATYDSLKPVTNFTKYYEDDENIVDEDLVFWITSGVHHIPHSEDLPITPTVGAHLAFFLSPYNYFKRCPSFSSRDHVRIELKDKTNPQEGVTVDRNGYKDEQCRTPQAATAYEQVLRDDPDVVVESRKELGLF